MPLQFWVIWGALIVGLFVLQTVMGEGFESGEKTGEVSLIFRYSAVVLCVISCVLRFLVIPRIKTLEQQLPTMIVGMAIAEGGFMLSLFMIRSSDPSLHLQNFTIVLATMLLHAPIYAKKEKSLSS